MENRPLIGLVEVVEKKNDLENKIDYLIQEFIQSTGIIPRIKITETEYNTLKGTVTDIRLKIIVEL